MFLIIDSGSTKSDWFLIQENGDFVDSYKTIGFNPFFHSTAFIKSEIAKNKSLLGIADKVSHIYYYGAGCSTPDYQNIVKNALDALFPVSQNKVDHDMKAALYATFDEQACITCILGTGSNACHFDGTKITESISGLGYILGDEGSGSFFGKKLLSNFLYGNLNEEITRQMRDEMGLNKEVVFRNVYNEPNANVYLAGYTRYLHTIKDDPFIKKILDDGMKEFMQVHVCRYPDYKTIKTHFIGSIAFYFQENIKTAAAELDVPLGKIIKSPIQNLVAYHVKHIIKVHG
jgi:N-acetylglucosamine kinase-like BadF-type ATPase